MFTIRQMRYFDALASLQHFGLAAEHVGISQPALSVQIAEMEKTIGAQLFERLPKKAILTDVGRNFLPLVRDLLKQMQKIDEMSDSCRNSLNTTWRIGIIPTISPYLLPYLLPKIAAAYPDLKIEIIEDKTENLANALETGRVDLVIAANPFPLDTLEKQYLFSDHFYLVTHKSDTIYRDMIESPEDIDYEQLLLLDEGHCFREQALAFCKKSTTSRMFAATSFSTLISLVVNKFGITFIPQLAYHSEKHNENLRFHSFKDQPKRDIALFWRERSSRKKEYEDFAKIIRSAALPLLTPLQE